MKVSVIIPTLNRSECLRDTMNDLLQQGYKPLEIVIVDQSPQPDSPLLNSLKGLDLSQIFIKYYHVNFKGLPRARNFGWQTSSGEILIYLDDDVKLRPRLIHEHVECYSHKEIGIVAGGIDEAHRPDNPNPTRTGAFDPWTATPYRDFNSKVKSEVVQAPGGNFSCLRKVLTESGGFDESLGVGAALYEETDFCLRVKKLNYKVWFNPDARLTHLAFATGGCRVPEVPNYIWSMSRNRMVVISRHIRWYHMPTAILRQFLYILSYTRTSMNPITLFKGCVGLIDGLKVFRNKPLVTRLSNENILYTTEIGQRV